jgi:hypothetical protein
MEHGWRVTWRGKKGGVVKRREDGGGGDDEDGSFTDRKHRDRSCGRFLLTGPWSRTAWDGCSERVVGHRRQE